MQAKQPILTIGIPTWNRVEDLRRCIRMWAEEINKVDCVVEIFVSDNASDDRTPEVLAALAKEMGFLRYSRNQANLGADRNFLEVFRNSSGKYVWLFSDDDFVERGALSEILRIIETRGPSYISTNFAACDDEARELPRSAQPHLKFMVSKDIPNADIRTIFARKNHWISFMGSNIYRRDLLAVSDYEERLSYLHNWIQVYVAAHVLFQDPSGYMSSCFAVKWRSGYCRCTGKAFYLDMPECFNFIADRFSFDGNLRKVLNGGIRKTMLPLRRYILNNDARKMASSRIVPGYYKIASKLPLSGSAIKGAWRFKRLLCGKGFSLPDSFNT